MNIKLLKEPINLPKIALILGIAYLAFNLCLDMPIHTLLCSELFESFGCTFLRDLLGNMYDIAKYTTPLFVLVLLFFNTLKQKSKTSKIAVILYGVYVLLSFTLPTLSEPIVGYKYNWWSELYDNNVFICRAITHHILTITPLLQIAALGYFADSNRKNTITFRVTIVFILYLFATQAFPSIIYRFRSFFSNPEWIISINKLHVCLIPAAIFAIRNRKNIALCISSLAYILHTFLIVILANCVSEQFILTINVSALGVYIAMIILFFRKNFKIEFVDIFILLALTSILCSRDYLEKILSVNNTITMLWSIGIFAAVAADHLSTKSPTGKNIKLAIISIFSSILLISSLNLIFGDIFNFVGPTLLIYVYPLDSWQDTLLFLTYIGVFIFNGFAMFKLFKLTKEEEEQTPAEVPTENAM